MSDNYVECLSCGNRKEIKNIKELYFGIGACVECGSKHIKLETEKFSLILIECKKCFKFKDIKITKNLIGYDEKLAKETTRREWIEEGTLCSCSNSPLWWILGIGAVVIIAASLIGYFWWKKAKKDE
ncbi:hypothetical protein [endosymbiont GvMRE of Glomus versiforme]|uniref:hypothetical protein n=1 Tax=endosymbiont GvMRE of Glomus versiforme TaxID=2039283 RepID=UPI000EE33D50|nr:hypothetical protein [endosymbiont GvMRE of Glomus versiforme]RHZ36338.1 hypothetical protein GvMRE_Ic1g206 [endosymbiont GvMRE of Glomus versiforme]